MKNVPIPARTRWSSSASPTCREGVVCNRLTTSCASQPGPSTSGPRCPTSPCSSAVSTRSSIPSWWPTVVHSSLDRTARTPDPGRGLPQAAPARWTCQEPPIRRWLRSVSAGRVSSAASLVSRCLPAETTSRTTRPCRSAVASDGQRSSARLSDRPASAASRRWAVRQTTSPSGML